MHTALLNKVKAVPPTGVILEESYWLPANKFPSEWQQWVGIWSS